MLGVGAFNINVEVHKRRKEVELDKSVAVPRPTCLSVHRTSLNYPSNNIIFTIETHRIKIENNDNPHQTRDVRG